MDYSVAMLHNKQSFLFWLSSLAVNGALVQTRSLGVSGRIFSRPGGQRESGTIGVSFAAGGNVIKWKNAIASLIDLNAAPLVGVQTIDFSDHSCVALGQTALHVVDRWLTSDIPGASDGFRGHGAIRSGVCTTPQIRADSGVCGAATVVVVAFLVQCQVIHALAVVNAANCLGCGCGTTVFAEVERIGSIEHGAHII